MLLFLIKKTFFDMWDNLLIVVLMNFGAVLLVGGVLYILQFGAIHPGLFVLGVAIAFVLLSLYFGAIARVSRDIADYKRLEFVQFFRYIRQGWISSVAFGGIVLVQLFILFVALPWYFSRGNLIGIAVAGLLFWGSLIWILASQYYFPVRERLHPKTRKIPLKCLILFFDNTLFTILLAIGTVVLLILSGFTAFLFPGLGTIMLWHQVGVKLRLYKYDYIEAHPRAGKNPKIPWKELLEEDRERVGPRTLRGMIFPWKG